MNLLFHSDKGIAVMIGARRCGPLKVPERGGRNRDPVSRDDRIAIECVVWRSRLVFPRVEKGDTYCR